MRFTLVFPALFFSSFLFAQGFTKLSPEQSGISFTNQVIETDMINGITWEYIYNGGGVSIGDFNKDGKEDIFFTCNQSENKLYINKGNMTFVDASKKYLGKVQPEGFNTGSTVVDINNDGYLDVYVSRGGWYDDPEKRRNLLYVNQGGKKFLEMGVEYGIADTSCTTQSAFFDADLDGDLDLYCVNYIRLLKRAQPIRKDQPQLQSGGEDSYYENRDGKYVLATKEKGLAETPSFGLGIAVSDINGDRYPDFYVCNDYNEPDHFYVNQGNGTFINVIKTATSHLSLYAMGVDIADINNDGLMDIYVLDMASEDHVRSKKNMAGMSNKSFWSYVNKGYHYQYMFNTLQLNMGKLKFSEIAQLSGVSKTDWSWAPLIADFDNDGWQDLFVTNGYKRDVRDNDFRRHVFNKVTQNPAVVPFEEILSAAPQVKIPNYIYKNNGDLTFSNKVNEWGLSEEINTNGAAYADLDNDGDLDLIVNALDDPSYILRNDMQDAGNYLQVKLNGMPGNSMCAGARVTVKSEGKEFVRETGVTRGFQSSVSPVLHFGLGPVSKVGDIVIEWNEKEVSVVHTDEINTKIEVNYAKVEKININPLPDRKTLFENVDIAGLEYTHTENNTDDFVREILLPNKMSELGPFITAGDLNNDQLTDIFVGGSTAFTGEIFFQQTDGSFKRSNQPALKADAVYEDMTAAIFDSDNDGDNDLYVVSGSNEYDAGSTAFQDRLYINDGKGAFSRGFNALPVMYESGQKVLTHDLNKDGWMDVISFGRQVPGSYPSTPKTYVLLNQKGKFVDATAGLAPELSKVGMVTDALFNDFDSDGDEDLIVVGEWMPLTIFENDGGKWSNQTAKFGLEKTAGWWSSIAEFNAGGKKQFIAGNIGLNNKFHPTPEKPLQIYMTDFDTNGTNDIVLAKYQGAICYPVRGRECSSQQMPFIRSKFPDYSSFAEADLQGIYGPEMLASAIHFDATRFESSILVYENGKFTVETLPNQAQVSAVNAILVDDFNKDGYDDVVLLGNKFEAEVETIRYDAGFGILLAGDKNGKLHPVPNMLSGLYLNYDIKNAVLANVGAEHVIITLPKHESIKVLKY